MQTERIVEYAISVYRAANVCFFCNCDYEFSPPMYDYTNKMFLYLNISNLKIKRVRSYIFTSHVPTANDRADNRYSEYTMIEHFYIRDIVCNLYIT